MKQRLVISFIFLLLVSFQQTSTLNDLLENPFDIQEFKKAKGQSLSSLVSKQGYYFRPQEKGVYFRFFLFRGKYGFIYSADGQKKTMVRTGDGLQIVTFKPEGKYRDKYFDPTETLIELTASYNDPDIPELAFVGQDTTLVKKLLGARFLRKNNLFIYSSDNKVLILQSADGVVKCLKYALLGAKFDINKIPKDS